MPNHYEKIVDENTLKELYKNYGSNFQDQRKKRHLSGEDLLMTRKANEPEILLNKVDVSRLETGVPEFWKALTFLDIVHICKLYGFTVDDMIRQEKNLTEVLEIENNSKFVINSTSDYFNNHLGEFYCYYKSTKDKEDVLIEAMLNIKVNDEICDVTFIINPSQVNSEHKGKNKEYLGTMVYSKKSKSHIMILRNDQIGELVYITSMYQSINDDSLRNKCRIAHVVSHSAGSEKNPVFSKMVITDIPLNDKQKIVVEEALSLHDSLNIVEKKTAEKVLSKGLIELTKLDPEKYFILDIDRICRTALEEKGITLKNEFDLDAYRYQICSCSINKLFHSKLSLDKDNKLLDLLRYFSNE